jgi:thiol-disulfide isomerase/thioredoxin
MFSPLPILCYAAPLTASPQVIDFHATWSVPNAHREQKSMLTMIRCGPCHAIAPHFEALSKKHTNVNFLKCDVDEAKEVASLYKVTAMYVSPPPFRSFASF